MLLERIYDEDLAQASFVIGCQAKKEAIVVDPRRDLDVYVKIAEKNDMKIMGVTETHIHADFLSGTRELASATGATMYVSGEGGQDWQYEFDATRLYDAQRARRRAAVADLDRRAAHAGTHARAPLVPRHRRRVRGRPGLHAHWRLRVLG